jgi:cell division protein FtsB
MMESFRRFWRVALPVGLLLLAAIAVPVKLLDENGLERVERLEKELERLETANARVESENRALRREIESFHENPDYIERVARDELGMVGPNEVVYQFPETRP